MNEDDDQQAEAPQESIWQPLDGSAPVRPQPEASPLTFTKPRPSTFPASPAPAAQQAAPAWSGDRPVFVLATWWARAGAWILDNLLFGILISFVTIPLGVALGMTVEEAALFLSGQTNLDPPSAVTQPSLAYALIAAQILAPPLIAAVLLTRWAGQTPGKRATGIRVVTEGGVPLTLGVALKRELVWKTLIILPLSGLFFIPLLANYLWPLADPQNRAGQDFFAKTRVVTAPRP